MAPGADTQWLVDIHDEHGLALHRLCAMLGAESDSEFILRSGLIALQRRRHRLVDPQEQVGFLREHVVHQARSARGGSDLELPEVADPRQQEILDAMRAMPVRLGEILVVGHYLSAFGPELATVMRMTVRATNMRLEEALDGLRRAVGDPTPSSLPGVIESLSQEVTAALRSSARLVNAPSSDDLGDELETHHDASRTRVAWYVAVPLLVISLVVGYLVAGADGPGVAQTIPSPEVMVEPEPATSRSLPARVNSVPIYYVGRDDSALYREHRDLASTGDLVGAAIEAMLAVAPRDPDYRSMWSSGRLLETQLSGDVLTVDLTADAFEGIETEVDADLAALQMVYTASALIGNTNLVIRFSQEGGLPPEPFRHQADGVGRRGLDPMPLLWITAPRNGQQLDAGETLVVGTVKPGSSPPVVTITRESGEQILSQTVAVAAEPNPEGWLSWNVSVILEPGAFTIRAVSQVTEGEGVLSTVQDKDITVE